MLYCTVTYAFWYIQVGFSIQNLTGQPLRYLRQWEGSARTVQYLDDGQRGLLNFMASATSVRNNQVVQIDTYSDARTVQKIVAGKRLALQVAGYKWLQGVEADELGMKFDTLSAVCSLTTMIPFFLNRWISVLHSHLPFLFPSFFPSFFIVPLFSYLSPFLFPSFFLLSFPHFPPFLFLSSLSTFILCLFLSSIR